MTTAIGTARQRGPFSSGLTRLGRLLLLQVFAAALLCGQSCLNLNLETSSGGVPTGW